jgi:hypothetical protein
LTSVPDVDAPAGLGRLHDGLDKLNAGSWSAPESVALDYLTAVSCGSRSFCVAVDQAQNASSFTAGDAITVSRTAWGTPQLIDRTQALVAVSCASAAFCIAVEAGGEALTLSN